MIFLVEYCMKSKINKRYPLVRFSNTTKKLLCTQFIYSNLKNVPGVIKTFSNVDALVKERVMLSPFSSDATSIRVDVTPNATWKQPSIKFWELSDIFRVGGMFAEINTNSQKNAFFAFTDKQNSYDNCRFFTIHRIFIHRSVGCHQSLLANVGSVCYQGIKKTLRNNYSTLGTACSNFSEIRSISLFSNQFLEKRRFFRIGLIIGWIIIGSVIE